LDRPLRRVGGSPHGGEDKNGKESAKLHTLDRIIECAEAHFT
jgi:hypothetical protein